MFQRTPFLVLIGAIAAPASSSRSLRSVERGMPTPIMASRHALWSGVTSSGAKSRTQRRAAARSEVGNDLCGRPAVVARSSPAVVVGAAAPDDNAAVMR